MTSKTRIAAIVAGLVLVIVITFWLVNTRQSGEDSQGRRADSTSLGLPGSSKEVESTRDSSPGTATPAPTAAHPPAIVPPTTATATVTPESSTPPSPVSLPSPTPAQSVTSDTPVESPQRATRSAPEQLEHSPDAQSAATVQPTPTPAVDWPTLATAVASRTPRLLTLEAARQEVPFPILMPEYLPDGFESHSHQDFVMLLEGVPYGNEVKGVTITIRGQVPPADGFLPTFHLEQELGSRPEVMEIPEAVKSEEDVNGYPATIWESQNIDGRSLIVVNWEDPSKGMWVSLHGFLTKAEAISVLQSLR